MRPVILGVLNVTPDSFSDGGHFFTPDRAAERALALFDDGADVVDIGGESTRPGAESVSVRDEIARVVPVIEAIRAQRPAARLSIDTTKSDVARAALQAGASIVNDVSGLRLDPAIAEVCAEAGCPLILMHSRGRVDDMARYDHARYNGGVMREIIGELETGVARARAAGVARDAIVLDPGIGFAKRGSHSVEALGHLPELVALGYPVMVGVSRKRFVGELTGVHEPAARVDGTVGANVAALMLGATWFRVHDVRAHRHALDVAAAVLAAGPDRVPAAEGTSA